MITSKILGALVLAAAAGPAWAQQPVDVRRPAAADGRVEIENLAGSIRVIGWNREEVAVSGTLGPGAEGISVKGGRHRTRIEVETERDPHSVRSDLEIHVPAGSRVDVESFSAGITVSEVTGALRAESVNGNISISGAKEVDAQTVAGSVEVSGSAARVHAESVNGPVTVRGASGDLEASTVNGRLDVSGTVERGHLETVSGSVRFDGDIQGEGSLDAEGVSGEIELVLPAKINADFSISTFSGDIENELGPAPRAHKHAPEKEVEFTVGTGGATVSVKTLSGTIRLRKR